MRVELLGPLRVLDSAGSEVSLPAGRQRALLARLALEPGRLVSASALVDALWPESVPANASGALHTQVSRLRRVLGDAIRSESGGYRLVDVATDVAEFEALASEVEAASRDGAAGSVRRSARKALALWRGPALADVCELEFADAEITRLSSRRERVSSLLVEARLEIEGAEAVLAELAARHAADPLSESVTGLYMRALASAGRQAEALDVFEKVRSRLADELGVDPSPALFAAHLEVLRGVEPPAPATSRLPEPLSPCIGREADLASLLRLIDSDRLVTITGPGGTGKTRLAVEVAHRVEGEGLPVRLVELAAVADGRQVPDVVLDALHVGESILSRRTTDARARLVEVLRSREMVLVVDNCEHLVSEVADLLAHLLPRVPRLRVLATSRESLGITGETVYGLGPLSLPGAEAVDPASHAAIRLFAERGRQSDSSFSLTADNADTVARICAALDGLPLAIELAAARLRSMSLEDLASRLDDRFSLLSRGDRTAAPRQRTLRGVVDWSWALLEPEERRTLARMSVFSGDADLAAVTEVCDATVDLVAGLVDKSLVQRLPGGRYRLLETVREYASGRLAEFGETAEMYAAHAVHYGSLAEEAEPHLMRAEQIEWLERLGADHGNLTVAIRRMVAAGNTPAAYRVISPLSWYWWMRGYRKEGQDLAFQVRAMTGEVEPLHAAKVAMAGTWGLWAGVLDPDETAAGWELAQGIAERHGLFEVEPLLKMLPMLLALLNNDEVGVRRAGIGLDDERDAWVKGMVLLFSSEFSNRAGEVEQASAELAESNAIFESIGERFGIIMSLQGLAIDRTAAGDHKEARRLLTRALQAESEMGADMADSIIVEHLWRIDAEHGDDPEAVLARMRIEAERMRRVGNFENAISAQTSAAVCLRRLGRQTEARDELLAAEAELPKYVRFSEVSMRLYKELARVAADLGDRDLERRAAEVADESLWPFSS